MTDVQARQLGALVCQGVSFTSKTNITLVGLQQRGHAERRGDRWRITREGVLALAEYSGTFEGGVK